MLQGIGRPIDLHEVDRGAMKQAISHVVNRIQHRRDSGLQPDYSRPSRSSIA
jgi:hypothetical protein